MLEEQVQKRLKELHDENQLLYSNSLRTIAENDSLYSRNQQLEKELAEQKELNAKLGSQAIQQIDKQSAAGGREEGDSRWSRVLNFWRKLDAGYK